MQRCAITGPGRWIIVGALLLLGCGAEPAEQHFEVTARLDGARTMVFAGKAPAATPVRIGLETRLSAVASEAGWVVRPGPEAVRVAFSTSFRSIKLNHGSVRFLVEARDAGDWEPLFEERREAHEPDWRTHEIRLTDSRELRFRAIADQGVYPLFGSVLLLGTSEPGVKPPPDLILVVLDTLGAGSLDALANQPGATPRLDAFRAQSHSFGRAYAQYGNTLVSHASLFTGRYPVHHGVYSRARRTLAGSLVQDLADAGYRTAAFTEGAYVGSSFGFAGGFDAYDDGEPGLSSLVSSGSASRTFARAADWIDERRERFFLFVHTYQVHLPYAPRSASGQAFANARTPGDTRLLQPKKQKELAAQHNRGQQPIGAADLARLEALHLAEIHELDTAFGVFLDRLDARDRSDQTIVVVTSDHGEQFGEADKLGHGDSLHDRALRVPLAFRGPRILPGTSLMPVQLVDLMPTLFDLVGLPEPANRDGRSLAPLLRGGVLEPHAAFSEQRTAPGECTRLDLKPDCLLDRLAVRTERFLLESSGLPKYQRLIDLDADPEELRDVSADHPDELARHQALVDAYRGMAAKPRGQGPTQEIDAETRRRLIELGYTLPEEEGSARRPDTPRGR